MDMDLKDGRERKGEWWMDGGCDRKGEEEENLEEQRTAKRHGGE